MSMGLGLLALAGLLFLSGVFSGSETGVYSLSRVRLEADARRHRMAQLLQRVLANETGILITLLIGNNLMLELTTHLADHQIEGSWVPPWARELVVAVFLTPIVFLFGEILPKDLFHRRPHGLLMAFTPILAVARVALLPLTLPLQGLSFLLERLLGVREDEFASALGREEVLEVWREGTLEGIVAPQAEALARNVLVLRETRLETIMLPWKEVHTIDLDASGAEVVEAIRASDFMRLPALRTVDGVRQVVGYHHQLDLWRVQGEVDLEKLLRPIPVLAEDMAVDRALARMRISGQRLAVVGSAQEPLGLVTLMDLVATISGDPAA